MELLLSDPRREAIYLIAFGAFSVKSTTLYDHHAARHVMSWEPVFAGIPTADLEQVRVEGLAHGATTAAQFVEVYEARMRGQREAERTRRLMDERAAHAAADPLRPETIAMIENSRNGAEV